MRWEADRAVFAYSRLKLLAYALLGAAIAIFFGWAYATGVAPPGSLPEIAFLAGAPMAGIGAAVALAGCFSDPEVLTVDRQGILDKRISASLLSWPMITGLAVRSIRRQRFLMVQLAPQFEATLPKTRLARMAGANASFGMKGMAIPTHGLDGSMDDLLAAVRLYSGR